jgi:hypothetical protein
MAWVIADQCAPDQGFLPCVQPIDFSNRNIKFSMQPNQERFEPASLLFEGCATGQVEV